MKSKMLLSAALSAAVLSASIFSLAGCSGSTNTVNLMDGIDVDCPAPPLEEEYMDSVDGLNFALELLKNSAEGKENLTLSPASAMIALSMTSNGAKGKTQDEMVGLMGSDCTQDIINGYWEAYPDSRFNEDEHSVRIANSIWINKSSAFTPNEDFLKTNAYYYNAGVFSTPFDDTTVKDMNEWISENTDGEIDEMVKEIDPSCVMSLINTVLFDSQWEKEFDHNHTYESEFHNADGTKSNVMMMSSDGERYIWGDNVKGFVKDYKNNYQFAALLPEEDTDINDFISSLDSGTVDSILESVDENETAHIVVPEYENSCSLSLVDPLKAMGMNTAFDSEKADFSALGSSENGNLYIGSIMQNCTIKVNELGTKASAATKIDVFEGAAMIENEVILNRPFIYMIIDSNTHMPLFIGVQYSM